MWLFSEGPTGAHQSLRVEKPAYPRGSIGKASTVALTLTGSPDARRFVQEQGTDVLTALERKCHGLD